eukprot:sb/3478768/
MGGRPPDKKSYLVPFSCYLHIYAPIYDLMHILNIFISAGPRKFSWTCFDAKWSIYGGLTRDKKSYLTPFSRYLHTYASNYDFMYFLNISTSAGPRTFI